jgi:hypothetical protein
LICLVGRVDERKKKHQRTEKCPKIRFRSFVRALTGCGSRSAAEGDAVLVKRIADERASERQREQQRYENGWDQDRSSGDVAAHGRVPAAN